MILQQNMRIIHGHVAPWFLSVIQVFDLLLFNIEIRNSNFDQFLLLVYFIYLRMRLHYFISLY